MVQAAGGVVGLKQVVKGAYGYRCCDRCRVLLGTGFSTLRLRRGCCGGAAGLKRRSTEGLYGSQGF
ncbi:hypothetical protein O3I_003300 [Nocardia brasiliensis ATCC 700358]|uniref:Uncharacterized protein n=1 Tax=Nocardia brasiliensis (strain ATCC 700358 / HUJEG-1) TaxID=1133849 RepID=K0EH66_NOCB7|nr:hypothetical protein O3I_003300 [Nocardia brasiliensis ATCC 700358]